jgi:hypothetical protein
MAVTITLTDGELAGETVTLPQVRRQFTMPGAEGPIYYRLNADGVTASEVPEGGDSGSVGGGGGGGVGPAGPTGPAGPEGPEGPAGAPGELVVAPLPRDDVELVTGVLAAGAEESTSIELGRSWHLLGIETDRPARVRLYPTAAHRDADAARPIDTDPDPETDHGVLAEFVTADALLALTCAPHVGGANRDDPVAATAYALVQNLDDLASSVAVTLTRMVLEGVETITVEGPEGPQGEPGPAGPEGPAGTGDGYASVPSVAWVSMMQWANGRYEPAGGEWGDPMYRLLQDGTVQLGGRSRKLGASDVIGALGGYASPGTDVELVVATTDGPRNAYIAANTSAEADGGEIVVAGLGIGDEVSLDSLSVTSNLGPLEAVDVIAPWIADPDFPLMASRHGHGMAGGALIDPSDLQVTTTWPNLFTAIASGWAADQGGPLGIISDDGAITGALWERIDDPWTSGDYNVVDWAVTFGPETGQKYIRPLLVASTTGDPDPTVGSTMIRLRFL